MAERQLEGLMSVTLEKIKEILHCDMTDMDQVMSLYLGLCIFKMLN